MISINNPDGNGDTKNLSHIQDSQEKRLLTSHFKKMKLFILPEYHICIIINILKSLYI